MPALSSRSGRVSSVARSAITARGWTILELAGEAPSLEEVFLRLVGSGVPGAPRHGKVADVGPDRGRAPFAGARGGGR